MPVARPAMLAYILRRLLLIVPTLLGIMVVNFVIVQAAPGGPVEQAIADITRRRQTSPAASPAAGGDLRQLGTPRRRARPRPIAARAACRRS